MKKFITIFMSLMLLVSNSVIAKATEDTTLLEQREIISVIEDGNSKAVVIQEKYGVFTYEYYENDVLIRSQTKDLFSEISLPKLSYLKSNYEVIESDSGWGIATIYDYDFFAFNCPEDYVDEGEVEDSYLEVEKGKDDNYVNQFKLRLIDYIDYENELYDVTKETLISAVIAAITLAGAVYFGNPKLAYQSALDTISTFQGISDIDYLIKEMTELQDEMAFFYVNLFKYDIS